MVKQKYYLALTRQMAVAAGVTGQLKAGKQHTESGSRDHKY